MHWKFERKTLNSNLCYSFFSLSLSSVQVFFLTLLAYISFLLYFISVFVFLCLQYSFSFFTLFLCLFPPHPISNAMQWNKMISHENANRTKKSTWKWKENFIKQKKTAAGRKKAKKSLISSQKQFPYFYLN